MVCFDYLKLDFVGYLVCLCLNSIVVSVCNCVGGVDVGYSCVGCLYWVCGKYCVMVCYNMMVLYLLCDFFEEQVYVLSQNVKFLLVYIKVLLCNWQVWKIFGIYEIYVLILFYLWIKLDFLVDFGSYWYLCDLWQLIGVYMVYVLIILNVGMDVCIQVCVGCSKFYVMSFE